MGIPDIVAVISVVVAISNGIGLICMYLRYIRVTKNAIMSLRATEEGLIEIIDLLPVSSSLDRK